MTCPSCGRIAQPGAAWCINVSCADYETPFQHAAAPAPQIWWAVSHVAAVPVIGWFIPIPSMNAPTVAAFKALAVAGAGLFIALVWYVTSFQERRFAPVQRPS